MVGSGIYGVGTTDTDLIPGTVFERFNGFSSFTEFAFFNDIRSVIVMEDTAPPAVPLPARVPLLGGALLMLAGLRRKRTRG